MKRPLTLALILSLGLMAVCAAATLLSGCASLDRAADQIVNATSAPAPGKAPTTAQAVVQGVELVAGAAAASGNPIGIGTVGAIAILAVAAAGYQKLRAAQKTNDLALRDEAINTMARAGIMTAELYDQLHPKIKDALQLDPPASSPPAATTDPN